MEKGLSCCWCLSRIPGSLQLLCVMSECILYVLTHVLLKIDSTSHFTGLIEYRVQMAFLVFP